MLIRNPDLYPEKNALRVEFTLKGGRRKVFSRLKVGTLGGLLEEYTRIVNFFWRNCQAFAFDNIGRRPSFHPKRGSLKELTDYFVILGLASLSHAELDGYTGLLSKGLSATLESGCGGVTSGKRITYTRITVLNLPRR